MIVKLSLDNQRFSEKPSKLETAMVSKRIGKCVTDIQISEFARNIVQPHGRTFSPAIFINGNRSNKTWISQQVFALDIDSGITIDQVLNKCHFLNLAPNFIYTTFSHTEQNPKFRVVFVVDEAIEDIRVRNLIQKSLMRIFPQVDSSTGDPSRIFFGGKEVVYEDFSSIIPLLDIYHAACVEIRGGSNPSRDMEKYCMSMGVDMVNGNPKVQIFSSKDEMLKIDIDDNMFISTTKKWAHSNTNNRVGPDFSHTYYVIYFNKNNTANINRTKDDSFGLTFEVEKHRIKRSLVRGYNFEDLYKYCKLYRESLDGKYWLYHDEMFGVMTNLLQIKGGSTKLDAILNSRSEYQDKISSWKIMKNQIIKANYSPMRCDNYCPFIGECIHNINMIEQGKLIFGRVQVRNEVKTKTISEARNELKMIVQDIIENAKKGIYVIKAPAGLGKTEEYISACKDHNLTIAVPTHRLKEGVSERLSDKSIDHFSIPELPHMENSKRQRLERLYNTGAFRGAKAYLNKLAVENVEIKEYLDELDNARDIRNKTILTTHKRVLHDKDHNDTIIIDEDIILSALFDINTVSIWDITLIIDKLIAEPSNAKLSRSKRIIDEILSILINSPEGLVQKTPNFFMPYANEIEKIIALDDRITTNVISFLSSSHFIKIRGKDGDIQIRFINRMQLPDKKIIILSATIDEVIAKKVFGEQIYFHDVGEVEQMGELIQIANKSFTKSAINKNPKEMYNLAKNLMKIHNPNSKVITFKGYFDDISEEGINFWNNAGIDELKGKDLTIIGTPHVDPYFYLLFANALGYDVQFDGSKINYLPVSDGNYKFYFYTYGSDDFLRAIQFYIVKTELIQAVGRARTITEPCRVLILSNFPVPGAEFIPYTKREIMDLKVS